MGEVEKIVEENTGRYPRRERKPVARLLLLILNTVASVNDEKTEIPLWDSAPLAYQARGKPIAKSANLSLTIV